MNKLSKIYTAIALSTMLLLSSCSNAEYISTAPDFEPLVVQESINPPTAPIAGVVRTDNYSNFDFPYALDYIDRSSANINHEYDNFGYCAIDDTIHYTKAIFNDYNSAILGCGMSQDPAHTGYVYVAEENKSIIDLQSNPSAIADKELSLCDKCFHEDNALKLWQQFLIDHNISNADYILQSGENTIITNGIVEHSDYTKFQDGYNTYWTNPDNIISWDYMPHIHTTFSYAEIPYIDGSQTIHAVKSVQNLEQFAVIACDPALATIDYRDTRLPYGSIKQFTHDNIAKYIDHNRIYMYTDPVHTLCPTCFDSDHDVEKFLNHARWIGLENFYCQVADSEGYYTEYSINE